MRLVRFNNRTLRLVITEHARERKTLRQVTEADLVSVVEQGQAKVKTEQRYWIYLALPERGDNSVALSVSVEGRDLVIITVMVNWEPT